MNGEQLSKALALGPATKEYDVVLEPPGAHIGSRKGPLWTVIGVRRDTANGRLVLELDELVETKKAGG